MNRQAILVVDDEKDILDALYDTFHERYHVFRANSADEALRVLAGNHVDLVMSDQRMPEKTGVEFFAEVEEKYPDIGKVLLTGYSDVDAIVDAINRGSVDKYVTKPWDEDQLAHIVLEVLNHRLKKAMEERKALESQLVQNEKLASLGQLVAGVAHELNNPLGFIHANMGNLNKFVKRLLGLIEGFDELVTGCEVGEALEKRKEKINYSYLKTRIVEMIDKSKGGADRMKKIITDLKTFSRLDAAEVAEADIHDAIDTTISIMFHDFKNRIEIKKEYGDIPLVECYIGKLNQVFMNLLVNGCQAINGQGSIHIATRLENGMVALEFGDTGIGMSEDVVKKIFDPFFTTKPVGQGTGLGLSISHGIIKQHKGDISVKSMPGKGTTFTIKLPLRLQSGISQIEARRAVTGNLRV